MHLFVGLGNPGPKYAKNRHNIGFMAVDAIASQHRFGSERGKFQGRLSEGSIPTTDGAVRVLVLKPETYMNDSGRAVAEAVRFYKIPLENVAVFYDEIDLAPGKVRVRVGGGTAGHNGVRSIASLVGPDFVRVRLGVGRPAEKAMVRHYVLSDFARSEEDWVETLCAAAADAAGLLAEGSLGAFQTRVSYLAPAPKPPAEDAS